MADEKETVRLRQKRVVGGTMVTENEVEVTTNIHLGERMAVRLLKALNTKPTDEGSDE